MDDGALRWLATWFVLYAVLVFAWDMRPMMDAPFDKPTRRHYEFCLVASLILSILIRMGVIHL